MSPLTYKSTTSNQEIPLSPADPENVGLQAYHMQELAAIERFLGDDQARILAMGGTEGTGKTHTAKSLSDTTYFDTQRCSMDPLRGFPRYFDGLIARNRRPVVIDEAVTPLISTTAGHRDAFKQFIIKCLEHTGKVILLGGGPQLTSGEQTDMLASFARRDVGEQNVQTHSFQLRPLNIRQVIELVELKNKNISRELVQAIAETYLEFFRLLRPVTNTCSTSDFGPEQWREEMVTESLTMELMPTEDPQFTALTEEQLEKRRAIQTLLTSTTR